MSTTPGPEAVFPTEMMVAGDNLRIDLATGEVARALEEAGLPCLLLKGPALALLLYDSVVERPYVDVDFLVSPDDWVRVGEVLASLDFKATDPAPGIPLDRAPYGREWVRLRDRVNVDLHEGLAETTGDRTEAWAYLWAHRDEMVLRGQRVWVLDVARRALLVGLHAAHHRGTVGKTLEDLRRAIASLPEEVWHEASESARVLACEVPFAAGLRMVEEGETLAARLGLSDRPWLPGLLFDSPGDEPSLAVALGFERLHDIKGVRGKAAFAFRKLFPPRRYMDGWIEAHPVRGGIAVAYVWRLARLTGHLFSGVRRWRTVKTEADRRGDDQ